MPSSTHEPYIPEAYEVIEFLTLQDISNVFRIYALIDLYAFPLQTPEELMFRGESDLMAVCLKAFNDLAGSGSVTAIAIRYRTVPKNFHGFPLKCLTIYIESIIFYIGIKMTPKTKLFSFHIDKQLWVSLKKIAGQEYRSIASLINQAIKEFLDRRTK